MSWWDHEELKNPMDRSDKYILAFPDEYPTRFVQQIALKHLSHKDPLYNLANQTLHRIRYFDI